MYKSSVIQFHTLDCQVADEDNPTTTKNIKQDSMQLSNNSNSKKSKPQPIEVRIAECQAVALLVNEHYQQKQFEQYVERLGTNVLAHGSKVEKSQVWIRFKESRMASQYVEEWNFKERIGGMIVNASLKYRLDLEEMLKLTLRGVTEAKLRTAYDLCKQLAPCKLYTKYSHGQMTGQVTASFVRLFPIEQKHIQELNQRLQQFDMEVLFDRPFKIFALLDGLEFAWGDDYNLEALLYQNRAYLENLVLTMTGQRLQVDVMENKTTFNGQSRVKISGLIDLTRKHYLPEMVNELRQLFVNHSCKVALQVSGPQKEQGLVLFTQGLKSFRGQASRKKWEQSILQVFQSVHKSVLHVQLILASNGSYRGHLYFPSCEFGKAFYKNWHYYAGKIVDLYIHGNTEDIYFDYFKEKAHIKRHWEGVKQQRRYEKERRAEQLEKRSGSKMEGKGAQQGEGAQEGGSPDKEKQ